MSGIARTGCFLHHKMHLERARVMHMPPPLPRASQARSWCGSAWRRRRRDCRRCCWGATVTDCCDPRCCPGAQLPLGGSWGRGRLAHGSHMRCSLTCTASSTSAGRLLRPRDTLLSSWLWRRVLASISARSLLLRRWAAQRVPMRARWGSWIARHRQCALISNLGRRQQPSNHAS